MKLFIALLFLMTSPSWAGGTEYVDGKPIGGLQPETPDYSNYRLTPSPPGYNTFGGHVTGPGPGQPGSYAPIQGSEGIANFVNNQIGAIGKHAPPVNFDHIENHTKALKENSRQLENATRQVQDKINKLDQAPKLGPFSTKSISQSDRIAQARERVFKNKVAEAVRAIDDNLREYLKTDELRDEISKYKDFSPEKNQVVDLAKDYAATASSLRENSGKISREVYKFTQVTLETGLSDLTEAAAIAGGTKNGAWGDYFGVSKCTLEMAKALLDFGLSVTPGISVGKDVYEALSGKSIIDGSQLDITSRSFAVLGVVTAGGSNVVKSALKGLVKVGHTLHSRALVSHGMGSAIKLAESGITDIVKHTPLPIHVGDLHKIAISDARGPMEFISQTFRSETYFAYKTTQPMKLYRVVPSTTKNAEAHFGKYWTRIKPEGPVQSMIDSALDLSFENTAAKWVEITVPASETLYEGIAASIPRIGQYSSNFVGGGNQVYINRFVPSGWVEKVVKF